MTLTRFVAGSMDPKFNWNTCLISRRLYHSEDAQALSLWDKLKKEETHVIKISNPVIVIIMQSDMPIVRIISEVFRSKSCGTSDFFGWLLDWAFFLRRSVRNTILAYLRLAPSTADIRKWPYFEVISRSLSFQTPISLSLLDYWIYRFSSIFSFLGLFSQAPLGKQPSEIAYPLKLIISNTGIMGEIFEFLRRHSKWTWRYLVRNNNEFLFSHIYRM